MGHVLGLSKKAATSWLARVAYRIGLEVDFDSGFGVALGSSGSEAKAERVGKKFFQAKNARFALGFFRPFGTCGWGDHYPSAEALGYYQKASSASHVADAGQYRR